MTKEEKLLIEDLAVICTRKQEERDEFIFLASALWSISHNNKVAAKSSIVRLNKMK